MDVKDKISDYWAAEVFLILFFLLKHNLDPRKNSHLSYTKRPNQYLMILLTLYDKEDEVCNISLDIQFSPKSMS